MCPSGSRQSRHVHIFTDYLSPEGEERQRKTLNTTNVEQAGYVGHTCHHAVRARREWRQEALVLIWLSSCMFFSHMLCCHNVMLKLRDGRNFARNFTRLEARMATCMLAFGQIFGCATGELNRTQYSTSLLTILHLSLPMAWLHCNVWIRHSPRLRRRRRRLEGASGLQGKCGASGRLCDTIMYLPQPYPRLTTMVTTRNAIGTLQGSDARAIVFSLAPPCLQRNHAYFIYQSEYR